jgi:hypothetical protein
MRQLRDSRQMFTYSVIMLPANGHPVRADAYRGGSPSRHQCAPDVRAVAGAATAIAAAAIAVTTVRSLRTVQDPYAGRLPWRQCRAAATARGTTRFGSTKAHVSTRSPSSAKAARAPPAILPLGVITTYSSPRTRISGRSGRPGSGLARRVREIKSLTIRASIAFQPGSCR